jgi:hypothetical protein
MTTNDSTYSIEFSKPIRLAISGAVMGLHSDKFSTLTDTLPSAVLACKGLDSLSRKEIRWREPIRWNGGLVPPEDPVGVGGGGTSDSDIAAVDRQDRLLSRTAQKVSCKQVPKQQTVHLCSKSVRCRPDYNGSVTPRMAWTARAPLSTSK